ncbi:MAG TPA: glycosyltransferase [Longimicrobiales bacterium]|nr:glycosyltransferase [Longimicrobiales bacterium]
MTTAPLVSVLLPVRDGAAYLDEAIASLEDQTLADFEVVAVDDGSTDATAELLAAWARRDRRVRVVRQPPAGIVAALERARSEARAPWLARMDADDISEPTRLAAQLALMERDPSLVACGCAVTYFPEDRVREGALRYQEWINAAVTPEEIAREMFVECPLAHPTFFLSASAVDAVGGYRDPGWPEDYDLVLRLWAAGGRLGKVPEPLLRWREGPDRLSRIDPRYGPEAFLACKVHHLRTALLDGRDGVVVWGAGPVGKAAARALLGTGVAVRAFVELDPRKIGQEIHGAPVLDVEAGVRVGRAEGPQRARPLHLAAVGQPGARERIRATLREAGLRELEDFVAIA